MSHSETFFMVTDGNITPVLSLQTTPQAAWRVATFIFVAYFAEVVASQTPGTLLPSISKELGISSSDSVGPKSISFADLDLSLYLYLYIYVFVCMYLCVLSVCLSVYINLS